MTITNSPQLASALRAAASAHHQYEQELGHTDENWPDWYAEYITRLASPRVAPVSKYVDHYQDILAGVDPSEWQK